MAERLRSRLNCAARRNESGRTFAPPGRVALKNETSSHEKEKGPYRRGVRRLPETGGHLRRRDGARDQARDRSPARCLDAGSRANEILAREANEDEPCAAR